MHKIALDCRALAHPEPLEKSMKILHSLGEEEYLYMLHRKNPIPLIDFAKEKNMQVLSEKDEEGQWHILISKKSTIDLNDLLYV